jgi:pimeloyl-ACP methyl ester carboxylesterase/acyl carrier protein
VFSGNSTVENIMKQAGFLTESIAAEWVVLGSIEEKLSTIGSQSTEEIISFLKKTFSELLCVDENELDIDVNLQEYGLDSILISQSYMLLHKQFGDIISPQELVENSTLKKLGLYIKGKLNTKVIIKKELSPDSKSMDPTFDSQKGNNLASRNIEKRQDAIIPLSTKIGEILLSSDRNNAVGTSTIQFNESVMKTEQIVLPSGREYEIVSCGEGPVVVFLTGLAFSWKIWRFQIQELMQNYRLIFPQLPGHNSSKAENGPFTFANIASDLNEIYTHLRVDSSHVVGWCMGGNIAQLFAAEYGKRIKTLSLIGTTPTDARMRGLNAEDIAAYSSNPLQTYRIEFKHCLKDNLFADQILDLYLAYLSDSYSKVADVYVITYMENLFKFDAYEIVKNINVPTMIVSGKYDIAFPTEQVKLLHLGIKNSKYVEFEKSGHMPFLTQYDRFNGELRAFFQGLDEA